MIVKKDDGKILEPVVCRSREKIEPDLAKNAKGKREWQKSQEKAEFLFIYLIVCYYDQQIGSPEIGDMEKLPVDLDLLVSGNWN
jgi:hypothetical protein